MATGGIDVDDRPSGLMMNNLFGPDDVHEDSDIDEIDELEMTDVLFKPSLINPTNEMFEVLLEQLRERLNENHSECIYTVGGGECSNEGLSESELDEAILTLRRLADCVNAECVELRRRREQSGYLADFLVRVRADERDFIEVRVAVVGNVDAGKSTLLGVLTHAELDNGRGYARQKLFRHKHEMETGRTSSVGNDILGFDSLGNIVNKPEHGSLDWVKICEKSSKVVTFIDLAGHEKYLKTTVFGMTGHAPDFSMLMVGANAGVVGMTKEHLGLALALGVPVFVVVTKIDMCPPNILSETLQMLHKILKSPGCRKMPVLVQTVDDVVVSATNFTSERMCPIFQVSNVTGENLQLLRMFLNLLSTRMPCDYTAPAEFQIDETFAVPGVGTVVSGTTLRGQIKLGDTLLLGPDLAGTFIPIVIKSIHRKRMPVKEVKAGQTASFALKKLKRSQLRKGMTMVSPVVDPKACWEFEGDILILHHPTTISVKYQAMVHVGSVRQTATIVSMSKDHLRTGDKAVVRFRFIKNPEYLRPDVRLVFREGRTKAVGTVTRMFPYTGVAASGTRPARTAVSSSNAKRETGQGSGHGQQLTTTAAAAATTTSHSQRPQNEPQKPSKRNRRGRGHQAVATGIVKADTAGAAAGKHEMSPAGGLNKLENKLSSASSGLRQTDSVASSVDLKRRESMPET